jgi:hypothetical protein
MKRRRVPIARSCAKFSPDPELILKSRTLAARKRNPNVQANYIIPVLTKAFTILDLLEKAERPMNTQQVSRITGYPLTTVYRILRTLSAYGYIPDGEDGIYKLKSSTGVTKNSEPNDDNIVSPS